MCLAIEKKASWTWLSKLVQCSFGDTVTPRLHGLWLGLGQFARRSYRLDNKDNISNFSWGFSGRF